MPDAISTEQLTRWIEHVDYADGPESRAMAEELLRLRCLLSEFVTDSRCHFDHNGSCQEHDFYEIEPGAMCPNAEALQYLKEATDA